jgi:hypothetical protein
MFNTPLAVVPAFAGTHNPGRLFVEEDLDHRAGSDKTRSMGPGVRRDDSLMVTNSIKL